MKTQGGLHFLLEGDKVKGTDIVTVAEISSWLRIDYGEPVLEGQMEGLDRVLAECEAIKKATIGNKTVLQ